MSKQAHLKHSKAGKSFWRDDWQRVKGLKIPGHAAPVYRAPDTSKTLLAHNDYWFGKAVWSRKSGVWSCLETSPSLSWMRQIPFDSIKNELLKRGCSWEWLPVNPPAASGASEDKHESHTMTSRTTARPDPIRNQASTGATGETQRTEKLLDQDRQSTRPNSKCSAIPAT